MYRLPYLLRWPFRLSRRARRSRLFLMLTIFCIAVLIISPFYVIYKPPNLLIRYFEHRWPAVLWRVRTSSKTIALTIDDAPSEYTEEIVKLLKDNEASATFFVIGSQADNRNQILRDMIRNGNELGNHAMRDEPSRSLDDATLREQIGTVEHSIHEAYDALEMDHPPKYFRPGSGFFRDRMLRNLANIGYRLVLGNIYPHDPQITSWRVNARHILSMIRPGGIIICHDRRSWTLPMLKRILPEIRKRGYRLTTVTQLLREEGSLDKIRPQ